MNFSQFDNCVEYSKPFALDQMHKCMYSFGSVNVSVHVIAILKWQKKKMHLSEKDSKQPELIEK